MLLSRVWLRFVDCVVAGNICLDGWLVGWFISGLVFAVALPHLGLAGHFVHTPNAPRYISNICTSFCGIRYSYTYLGQIGSVLIFLQAFAA